MAEVTITFDPGRLQRAIEDELDNHHVHLASGQCACGRFRGKDPARMRMHAAEEIVAVVLRFQRPKPTQFKQCGAPSPENDKVPAGTPCSVLYPDHVAKGIWHHAVANGYYVSWGDRTAPEPMSQGIVDVLGRKPDHPSRSEPTSEHQPPVPRRAVPPGRAGDRATAAHDRH